MAENIATLGFEFKVDGAVSAVSRIVERLDDLDEQTKKVMFGMELMSSYAIDSVEKIVKSFSKIPKLDGTLSSSIISLSNALKTLSFSTIGVDRNLNKVFETLSALPTLNDKAVTQFGAVANAVKLFSTPPDEEELNRYSLLFSILNTVKPIRSDIVTSLNAMATGLNKIKLSDSVTASFHDIVVLMNSFKPVSPDVTTSIVNFVNSINQIKPINATLPASIADFFNSFGNFSIEKNIATQIVQMGEALNKLKAVKPEVTVAIRELFNVFSNAKEINVSISDSVSALGEALIKFKNINPKIAVSIRDLFEALQGMPTLDLDVIASVDLFSSSTEKFKVISPKITKSIKELFEALIAFPALDEKKIALLDSMSIATAKFKVISPKISQSIKDLFDRLKLVEEIPANISNSIKEMSSAINGFKVITKPVADSVERIFNLIASLKPIPTEVLNSIRTLKDLFTAMANAGDVAGAKTTTLNRSVHSLSGRADGATLAIRALQGALSANFFVKAIHGSLDFARQLAYVKSIAMELSTVKIGTGLMNFNSVLGNMSENANALYYAYSSGIRGTEEEFLKFTEIASKTAQVNRAGLVPMIDAMTAAMNAFGMSVDEVSEVADNFFAIVKYGKASGEQLANSFGQVSPTAKTLGLTLDELGASIASLTKIQPTRVAITGLNNMLSKIIKPTKESQLAMRKLGVDVSYTAVQERGFTAVMNELHTALNGNKELLKNIIPDIRGQRAAMHLLGAGWADWNIQLDNFANKKGSMEEAFAVLAQDPSVQLGKIPETFKKITVEAGLMATNILTIGGSLTPLIQSFNSMSEGVRRFIAGLLLFGSSVAVFKGAVLTITTFQALMIRNQAIINAGQTKNTVSTRVQNAVLLGNAVANHKAAVAESNKARSAVIALKTTIGSLKAERLRTTMLALEARTHGDVALAQQLTTKAQQQALLIQAEDMKLRTAKIALMKQELKELTALTAIQGAANTANTAGAAVNFTATAAKTSAVATGAMNVGIFATASAGLGKLIVSIKNTIAASGLLTAVVTKLGAMFVWLGGILSKAWLAIKGIFSAVNITVTGVVAIALVAVDYLQSYIRTGTIANSITHSLINGVWDFFSGASKALKQAEENAKKTIERLNAQREFEIIARSNSEAIKHLFDHWGKDELPLDKFESGRIAYNNALDLYFSKFQQQLVQKANEIKKQSEKLGKAQKESGINSEAYKTEEEKLNRLKNQYDNFSKKADDVRKRIQMGGEKMYNVLTSQLNALQRINETIRTQDFKELSPKEQYKSTIEAFLENRADFERLFNSKDYEAGAVAFNSMTSNYNQIRDYINKHIAENNRLNEQMSQMRLEATLSLTEDETGKIAIYAKEFKKHMRQSELAMFDGDFGKSADSFKKGIDAQKQMLSLRNKLAQAEDDANKRTLDLIKSMSRLKTTAQDAVEANSGETTKLINREFAKLPAYNPKTTERDKADALRNEIAQSMRGFANDMSRLLDKNSNSLNEDKNRYMAVWNDVKRGIERNSSTVESGLRTIINTIQKNVPVTLKNPTQPLPTANV